MSGRGECRAALAYARLGSLYSRAPLTRRLCNLTRPWRRAPGCVLARGCLRTLRVRLRRIFPPKASLSSAHFSAIARLPSGASPSPVIPPPQAGSAIGGGIPRPAHSVSAEPGCGRRCGARGCLRTLRVRLRRISPPLRSGTFPAPADSCGAPRPHAARSAVARLGPNTSRRRIGGISLASVRVSRRHRLRLVPPPLQPAPLLHGTNDNAQLRDDALTLLTVRRAERAPQKRTCADSAQGDRRACHGARANPTPRGARRRRDGCDWRGEASRPSQALRSGGWIARRGGRRIRGGGVEACRRPPRARANRAAHRPRSGTQRCEMHRAGKRPLPNAIW